MTAPPDPGIPAPGDPEGYLAALVLVGGVIAALLALYAVAVVALTAPLTDLPLAVFEALLVAAALTDRHNRKDHRHA